MVAQRNLTLVVDFVADVLTYQNLSTGTLQLNLQTVMAAELLESCASATRPSASVCEIVIIVRLDESLHLMVDKQKVIQVLINLVSNAIKYSPPSSEVIVQCNRVEDWIEFAVLDSGPGIPANVRDKVFEPFQQLGSSKRQLGGVGLGLAICKLIVQAHGGTVGVISRSECEESATAGSKFWFRIPQPEHMTI
jgi:signal transduction histidine kinase